MAWSTPFAGLFLATLTDSFFPLINRREYIWTITGLSWIWLYPFFLFGNRGRLDLLPCSALLVFPMWWAGRFPAAVREAEAVGELCSMT
jgi:hypothetical protein